MDTSSHQPSSPVQPEINSPSSESVSTPVTPADPGVSDSDSLFSGPDTPKMVQRQIFGTETEDSTEETDKESKSKVWVDETEEDHQTQPDAKAQTENTTGIKPYCP